MTKEKNNKSKILTYGSLRKDEYNFNRFVEYYGKDNIVYLETIIIKGYDLYDLGSYPGIKKSNNPNKELVVDILEVSEDCFKSIANMEFGAGYDIELVAVGEDLFPIYVYNYPCSNLVESGDWSTYLTSVV